MSKYSMYIAIHQVLNGKPSEKLMKESMVILRTASQLDISQSPIPLYLKPNSIVQTFYID